MEPMESVTKTYSRTTYGNVIIRYGILSKNVLLFSLVVIVFVISFITNKEVRTKWKLLA